MKRTAFITLAAAAAFAAFAQPAHAITKVACVGDSITAGAGVEDRTKFYPTQLGELLGKEYEVRNFGVSGATMLDDGDKPYKKEGAYKKALEYEPDIVIIKLGTNDSKPENWSKKEGFVASAKSLVEAFRKANPKATVFFCTPAPVVGAGNFGITNEVVKPGIIPLVRQAAAELKLPIIDIYVALEGKDELIPDNVHPNEGGAAIIAKTVYEAIKKPRS